jgi:Uma2 family endonuclease
MNKRSNEEKTFKVTQEDYEKDLAKYGDPDVVRKPGTYVVRPSSHVIKRGDTVIANGKTRISFRQENKLYSVAEYLKFERLSEEKHEYIDGLIFSMVGASREHNLIRGNISSELRSQLKGRPCETYSSDMRVRTTPTSYTYPDVVIVCGKPEFEDKEVDTLLNPTVIFEVLSQSTEKQDYIEKFADYRSITTLKEYILVSQNRIHIEQYDRHAEGMWRLLDIDDIKGILNIQSVGCQIMLKNIYDRITLQPSAHLRRLEK